MRRQVKLNPEPVDARQFEVAVKHLANSLSFGQEESVFHGSGLEYAQSRLYVAGDPVKAIDWKVSARVGKLFIKEYQEPKQMPLYLLLDTSASMCVTSLPMSKYAWAVQIATGIALAAQSNVTPVGLLGCGARELHVRPTLSRNVVMEWSHQLRHHDFLEDTSLAARAREVAPSLKRRTMVIVLSDLHDPEAFPALQVLGLFRGVEAESGRAFVGHGRRAWVDAEGWKSELTRFGIDYLHLPTDEPILGKLRHFLGRRGFGSKVR
jgi:uncharacterized protein (DUF58 family)